ncbi:MAG: hypothetical protein HDR88_04430 [Bacteroides sp.]|nr:hypothetical protein [Bacteroides sp.]
MEKQLTFNKDSNGHYTTEFVSTGNAAVQICRTAGATLRVQAAIGNLTPISIVKFGEDSPKDLIFEIGIYAGVKVYIVSHSEVIEARMIEE